MAIADLFESKDFVGNFLDLIMVHSIYTILMIIKISGVVLTLILWRINTVDDLLISNSVSENKRNMSILTKFQ